MVSEALNHVYSLLHDDCAHRDEMLTQEPPDEQVETQERGHHGWRRGKKLAAVWVRVKVWLLQAELRKVALG